VDIGWEFLANKRGNITNDQAIRKEVRAKA
jgi:hypothetical protein